MPHKRSLSKAQKDALLLALRYDKIFGGGTRGGGPGTATCKKLVRLGYFEKVDAVSYTLTPKGRDFAYSLDLMRSGR